ncbi:MAG TPA: hypothetical protein VGI40_00040 [Pirellulaceae bacterium]|jgi:hypothetical protein
MQQLPASTPPFLLWAIGYQCPIRGFQDGSDPERTERQLRAAIATSEALRQGRVFEGYAVDEPLGFRIEEALALYGGIAKVEETCGACPANAMATHRPEALAGCVGLFALPPDDRGFCNRIEVSIEKLGLADECSRLFPSTRPRWYGFWIQSPLAADQVELLADIFGELKAYFDSDESMKARQAGLSVARDKKLPLHATLYPRGTIESNWWRLVVHCPRCKAEWKSVGRGLCEVCGYEGHPAPDKKRRARGRRPYLPLARLMGEQNSVAFLERYRSRLQ